MSQDIKNIYLHKLKFNFNLILENGTVKFFMKKVNMWIIICEIDYGIKDESIEKE